jgi:hypothetical protein
MPRGGQQFQLIHRNFLSQNGDYFIPDRTCGSRRLHYFCFFIDDLSSVFSFTIETVAFRLLSTNGRLHVQHPEALHVILFAPFLKVDDPPSLINSCMNGGMGFARRLSPREF